MNLKLWRIGWENERFLVAATTPEQAIDLCDAFMGRRTVAQLITVEETPVGKAELTVPEVILRDFPESMKWTLRR